MSRVAVIAALRVDVRERREGLEDCSWDSIRSMRDCREGEEGKRE